jgi:hypothetical protein
MRQTNFMDSYYPGREWCELHWYKIRVDLITRRIIQKYEKPTITTTKTPKTLVTSETVADATSSKRYS